MCQLAEIIICIITLCGCMTARQLAIGSLIIMGVQIACDVVKSILEKQKEELK